MADREQAGREVSPSGAIVDVQAARSGGVGVGGERGYDPARRVVGRKRHALTDTDGRRLIAAVSPANLHNSRGGIVRNYPPPCAGWILLILSWDGPKRS